MSFITLQNSNGLSARFTPYGARWAGMIIPDKVGFNNDVILGFDTLSGYKDAGEQYHGSIVGRVCGRIGHAHFDLDGQHYELAQNDVYGQPERNHLHGGIHAFHNRMWDAEKCTNEVGEESVVFSTFSADGEEGYPGNLKCEVTYTLTNDNRLTMRCDAWADRKTPVNLTNHAFFNLNPGVEKDVLNHDLQIHASSIIECDSELLPTGKLWNVEGTRLDFRNGRKLADSLRTDQFDIKKNQGFSLAFALDSDEELKEVAVLSNEASGRKVTILSNQPSVQVYTGYFMDGSDIGKDRIAYGRSAGVAIETQGFPDAVSHAEFPSIYIDPEHPYLHYTEFIFGLL